MEQQKNNPTTPEIKIALTSEERIASLLLDAIETFNEFFGLCNGIDRQSLEESNSNGTCRLRCRALIKSVNALKQILRIARPTINSLGIPSRDDYISCLGEIQKYLDTTIQSMDQAEMTPTKSDDLISSKWATDGYGYGYEFYYLTKNFWKIVSGVEEAYEDCYQVILECGLLTPLQNKPERRRKINEL